MSLFINVSYLKAPNNTIEAHGTRSEKLPSCHDKPRNSFMRNSRSRDCCPATAFISLWREHLTRCFCRRPAFRLRGATCLHPAPARLRAGQQSVSSLSALRALALLTAIVRESARRLSAAPFKVTRFSLLRIFF